MAGLECDAEAQARAATRDSVGQWPRHRPFPLAPRLRRIAIEVFAASVLGLEQGRRGAAVTAIEEWTDRWNDPQVLLPFLRGGFGARWRWRRFLRARAAVLALLEAALGEPLRAESVAARLKADGELGDEEIRDQLMSLLAAGLHPTANGLSWALALLAGDPRSARLLRERLAAGDESYLDAVIEETLRLRPVGQWMARRVKRPYRLRSGGLAPGSLLIPNTFLAHHDPSLHPDPERFLPRRFLGDSRASRASIPFGSGPRRCPGEAIATAQLRGVLREVLAAVDLRLAGSRPERLATDGVNLVPKRGARVIVSDPS
jgi:cytochrome P450